MFAWSTKSLTGFQLFSIQRQLMRLRRFHSILLSFTWTRSPHHGENKQQTINLSCFLHNFFLLSPLNNNHFIFIDSKCCPIDVIQFRVNLEEIFFISSRFNSKPLCRSTVDSSGSPPKMFAFSCSFSVILVLHWIKWGKKLSS